MATANVPERAAGPDRADASLRRWTRPRLLAAATLAMWTGLLLAAGRQGGLPAEPGDGLAHLARAAVSAPRTSAGYVPLVLHKPALDAAPAAGQALPDSAIGASRILPDIAPTRGFLTPVDPSVGEAMSAGIDPPTGLGDLSPAFGGVDSLAGPGWGWLADGVFAGETENRRAASPRSPGYGEADDNEETDLWGEPPREAGSATGPRPAAGYGARAPRR